MKNKNLSQKIFSLLIWVAIVTGGMFFILSENEIFGQEGGWKVWVKTSPCAGGRTDWISVAQRNPTEGGGGSFWTTADQIVSGFACTRVADQTCTFATATAVANTIRASAKFSDYCCRDYSIWENIQTKELSVVKGSGSAGYGWQFVDGPMCCEEAEKLSGKTGLCGGVIGGGKAGYIGCFKDTNAFDLDGFLERSRSNTPQSCIATCYAKGFNYAAVQYGESCLCGNSYGKYGAADNCNYKCTGDSGQICGGYSANSVYSTGATGNSDNGNNQPAEIDLSGTWQAGITESNTGNNFKYNLVLNRAAAGQWKGSFTLSASPNSSLGFSSEATVESLGDGNLRITYFAKGKTQVGNGTYTKDRITFGGSQNTVVFTRR